MMPRSWAWASALLHLLRRSASRLGDRQAVARRFVEQPVEVAAAHVLRDDVRLPAVVADVEDGDDVRVVAEASHRLRFALDACEAGVVQALGLDQRDRDVAVELRVVREVDLLAAALAEEALDGVSALGERGREESEPIQNHHWTTPRVFRASLGQASLPLRPSRGTRRRLHWLDRRRAPFAQPTTCGQSFSEAASLPV